MVLKSTDRVSILLSGMDRFREADKSVGASAVAAHTIDVDQDILTTSRLPELALGPHGCQQADTLGVKYVTTADATGRKNPARLLRTRQTILKSMSSLVRVSGGSGG
jgi:hypothetical protein